jgi:hypothetical protein
MLLLRTLTLNYLLVIALSAAPFPGFAQPDESDVIALPDVLSVCADINGFPPFSYDLPESRGHIHELRDNGELSKLLSGCLPSP